MLSFNTTFSLSSFSFIKVLFSSSLLSAIRFVSSAYLKLLIFLPAILIPACASLSPVFYMMYSASKLNSRVTIYSLDVLLVLFGTILLFHVQFLLLLADLHTNFSRGRPGGLVFPSLSDFSKFIVIHTVKGFGIVNKAEIDVFLELSCFSNDPVNVGNLISGSSAFSKTNLNIWKFTVHVLLKPSLENF